MYPSQFEYKRATTVKEASKWLNEDPDAKLIAGGHSLLPAMKLRLANPTVLVDLSRVPGLSSIEVKDGEATIGALTTYQQLLDNKDLAKDFPIIAEAAYQIGDPAVRARGTLGGSLAHSDPAADLTAVMLALNAKVKASDDKESRKIDIDNLFVDLLTTSLEPDEIITEIEIPKAARAQAYEKHAHPASGYAVVGVAVVLDMDGDTCRKARVAVTGAGVKATRAKATEDALKGKKLDAATIQAAAEQAAADLGDLNSDVYASAEYREHLTKVLAKRAISRAAGI